MDRSVFLIYSVFALLALLCVPDSQGAGSTSQHPHTPCGRRGCKFTLMMVVNDLVGP